MNDVDVKPRHERYLNLEERRFELANLETLYPKANHRLNDGLDFAMVPWLRAINELPGVVTLQCCEGHDRRIDEDTRHKNRATLRIRYTQRVGARLRDSIGDLAGELPYDFIAHIFFMRWDGVLVEFLDLAWEGLGHNRSLGPVLDPVISWLRAMTI